MFSDQDLLFGTVQDLAEFLGVTARQVANYKSGRSPLPEPCRKLLRLRHSGDLSALLGNAWEGFYFGRDGLLYLPGWRNGFDPHQIQALFFKQQEAAALRADLKQARSDVWALKKIRELDQDRARLRQQAATLKAFCEAMALEIGNNCDSADDRQGKVQAGV